MSEDLGQSAVPYSPTIIAPKEEPYHANLYEYLWTLGIPQIINTSTAAASQLAYTIPAGYDFFIVTANLSYATSSANIETAYIDYSQGHILQVVSSRIAAGIYNCQNVTLSFPVPLRIQGADALYIAQDNAGSTARCVIYGFLMKKDASIK